MGCSISSPKKSVKAKKKKKVKTSSPMGVLSKQGGEGEQE